MLGSRCGGGGAAAGGFRAAAVVAGLAAVCFDGRLQAGVWAFTLIATRVPVVLESRRLLSWFEVGHDKGPCIGHKPLR